MLMPLLSLAAGGVGSIMANQAKDPNEAYYKAARKRAKQMMMESNRDIGGAMAANIKNQGANVDYELQTQGVASGRGQSPSLMAARMRAANQTAGGMNDAMAYGADRSQDLISGAGDIQQDIAAKRAQYRKSKRDAVRSSLVGGATAGLSSYMQPQQSRRPSYYRRYGGGAQ